MSNHENLAKQTNQKLSRRAWLKHTLKVVSELSLGDVTVAERAVHYTHQAQMRNGPDLASENLRTITGRPVDIFRTSMEVDLKDWQEAGKVGEYHRSENGDTFAYTEIAEEKRSERLPEAVTYAFTSRPRSEVISNFGEPEKPIESNVVPFPEREELRPTG